MRSRIFVVAMLTMLIGPAHAGVITVVGDVNADSGNDQFYLNVLGGSSHVLFGRGSMFGVDGILSLYNTQGGVSVTASNTTLTNAVLANYDLLVFNQINTWNIPLAYSASELAAVSTFLASGGNLLLVAETHNDNYANLNGFLAGVGSDIRYTGVRTGNFPPYSISTHSLTSGVTDWRTSAYNTFSGGTPLVTDAQGNILVATSGSRDNNMIPEPTTWALTVLGIAGIGFARKRSKACN